MAGERQVSDARLEGILIGQSVTDKVGFFGTAPIVQRAGSAQGATGAAAPAGGSGATAGAYDSSANRDAAIVLINETRTLVNEIRTVLVNLGLMKGAA